MQPNATKIAFVPPGSGASATVARQLKLAKRVDRAYFDRRNTLLGKFEALKRNFGDAHDGEEDEDEPEMLQDETDDSLRHRLI